jgi:hypothetical protein
MYAIEYRLYVFIALPISRGRSSGDVIENWNETADDHKTVDNVEEASEVRASMKDQPKSYNLQGKNQHGQ